MKIFTMADVPDELAKAWLQHLRNFDVAHPGCHFQVMADAVGMPLDEVVEMLRVEPELIVTKILERRGK